MDAPAAGRIVAADGTPLHVADWPAAQPRGMRAGVMILHGIGEHGGRYAHVARFFNDLGFDVRIHDHRGHGRSGGKRGDVPDEAAIVRDAALVMQDFAQRFATPPLLLGHSMGGLFAARFAATAAAPISGLILSSPALAIPLSRTQRLLLAVLSRLMPGLGVTNRMPATYLSHDSTVVEAYCRDPLVHHKITARLLRSMLASIDIALQRADRIDVPTLLLVAGSDRVVDARGSEDFLARLRPGIRTIRRYPALYHEIFNETDAHAVFADLRAWLQAHALLPQAPLRSA